MTNRNRGYQASYLLRNYRAKKKKEKKIPEFTFTEKIKIYNKGTKNEKKSHYYIFCIHY